MQFMNFDHLF